MLVLGIDPGLAITGFGLIEARDTEIRDVDHGVIRTPAGETMAQRLRLLHAELGRLLERYHPQAAAVEELFFSTNARTAMSVSQARGVALFTLAEAGIEPAEYTPMQVKLAVTGYGGAGKSQVQEMVRLLLNLSDIPRPDDAADALAIAICHYHSNRLLALTDRL